MIHVRPAAGLLATAVGMLSACSSATPATTGGAPFTGDLTVLAASSLTTAFTQAGATLQNEHGDLHITFGFAGSQALVTQVKAGAPADVVATADQQTMQRLVDAGLVETPRAIARNHLEIAVEPGNPRGVHALSDLARADLVVVLADPSVPAGALAATVLQRASVTVTPRSLELSVSAVLQKVESGQADAGIVFVTDVQAASGRVDGVVIPESQNAVATDEAAVVRASRNPVAAAAFVDSAVGGEVQVALRRLGFAAP